MLSSMTGYASAEKNIASFGKVSVELRSTNHKYLDIVIHLPEGFVALEDKLRKEIESKIQRGRVTCAVNILPMSVAQVVINRPLIKKYLSAIASIRKEFGIKSEVNLDMLLRLPNALLVENNPASGARHWPALKALFNNALDSLVKTRNREGSALFGFLKSRALAIKNTADIIYKRFGKVIKEKSAKFDNDEERASFIKNSDITEEMERLRYHVQSFITRLSSSGPVGKELDFIAQEMQRETNTMGAKSCDPIISGKAVFIKGQIEKIREQLQNLE